MSKIINKKFKATWAAVTGADSYNLYLSKDGGSFVKENASPITETEYIFGPLDYEPYEAKVASVVSGEESELSDPASFTALPVVSTDFSEYVLGEHPSDWDKSKWHEIGWVIDDARTNPVSGVEKILYRRIFSSNRYLIKWDVLDGLSDVEILTVCLTPEFDVTNALRVYLRAGGDSTTENGYYLECDFDNDTIQLSKYDSGGSAISLSGTVAKSLVSNTWYRQRVRIQGTSIKAKVWEDGTTEPGSWDIEVTDSEYSSGWFGVGFFSEQYYYGAYFEATILPATT